MREPMIDRLRTRDSIGISRACLSSRVVKVEIAINKIKKIRRRMSDKARRNNVMNEVCDIDRMNKTC